jgi:hypothetical protein
MSNISLGSSQRSRRRKSPSALIEEDAERLNDEPVHKRQKTLERSQKKPTTRPVTESADALVANSFVSARDVQATQLGLAPESFASAISGTSDGIGEVTDQNLEIQDIELGDVEEELDTRIERGVPTPKSVVERLKDLLAEASMVTRWNANEQREIGDLAFELQALTRGR